MTRFTRLTLLFAAPIVLLLILGEATLRKIPNDYSYKRKFLEANSDKIEVLYLGNSHSYFGINPEVSAFRGFNAAYTSQSLDFDEAIFEKYQDKLSHLKCLVVQVDYQSLYTSLITGLESWRVKNYAIYYGIGSTYDFRKKLELTNGLVQHNVSRITSYCLNHKTDQTCNSLGWGTNYHSGNKPDLDESGKQAAKRHTVKDDLLLAQNLKTLNYFIEFAKERNIKIVFFTSPGYQTYVSRLDLHQLSTTVASMQQLVASHPFCSYTNLLEDSNFVAEDFYDADHLNEKGAQKLTARVDQLIAAQMGDTSKARIAALQARNAPINQLN